MPRSLQDQKFDVRVIQTPGREVMLWRCRWSPTWVRAAWTKWPEAVGSGQDDAGAIANLAEVLRHTDIPRDAQGQPVRSAPPLRSGPRRPSGYKPCLVGIPTLNGPDRLERALRSVFEAGAADDESITVLVADDGSTPENLERNKAIVAEYAVDLLLSPTGRSGIPATWNRLCRHRDDPTVILINDDVELVVDALDVLRYSVEENREAGMVSLPCYLGTTKDAAPQPPPPVDYHEAHLQGGGGMLLSSGGACFAFRREVYEAAGGFDERYFCFYEELDLGFTLRRLGYVHFVASYPTVYHLGGATNSDAANLVASERLLESRARFKDKWGGTPDELRRRFGPAARPANLREWNSSLKTVIE